MSHQAIKRGPLRQPGNHFTPFCGRDESAELADVEDLRALMFDGSATDTGNPLKYLTEAFEAAKRIRAASVGHTRFPGAEVDLAIARELRAISEAAQRAVTNLNDMAEFLRSE